LFTQVDPAAQGVQADVHSALLLSAAQVLFGHMWNVGLQD
jgi:hypothetical protein